MIFLDETGKRWRRIKLGTGLFSAAILTPIMVLMTASLLYMPSWGSFSIPTSASSPDSQVTEQASQASNSAAPSGSGQQPLIVAYPQPFSSTVSSLLAADSSDSSQSSPDTDTVPSSTETAPATTAPDSKPAPASQGQGRVNQSQQTGNSDFGHSH